MQLQISPQNSHAALQQAMLLKNAAEAFAAFLCNWNEQATIAANASPVVGIISGDGAALRNGHGGRIQSGPSEREQAEAAAKHLMGQTMNTLAMLIHRCQTMQRIVLAPSEGENNGEQAAPPPGIVTD